MLYVTESHLGVYNWMEQKYASFSKFLVDGQIISVDYVTKYDIKVILTS